LTNAIVFEDLCANYMNLILSMNYECILLDDTTHLYILETFVRDFSISQSSTPLN